jgi:hypothetical protein
LRLAQPLETAAYWVSKTGDSFVVV